MSEPALVSLIALLGWLILVWRSGAIRNMSGSRRAKLAVIWLAIFAAAAVFFRMVA